MARPLVTVISMQQNEERCIDVWYRNVKPFADEIIIGAIGPRPTDKYPDIKWIDYPAETCAAKGMCYVKNELIKQASGEWIVLLDGDEIMATTREILTPLLSNTSCLGFTTNTHCSRGPVSNDAGEIANYPVAFSGQNHYRIFRNVPGMHCLGTIHEETFFGGVPLRYLSADMVPLAPHVGMIHLGSCLERPHRHTVYGELMSRVYDLPSLRTPSYRDYWAADFARYEQHWRAGQQLFWQQRGGTFDHLFHPELAYGTHWELLERAIKKFDCKKVLELGTGHSSTPKLQALGLDLHSYETNAEWASSYPGIQHVRSYDEVPAGDYDLVFIDNAPAERRNVDIRRFADSICVVHDTEAAYYDYRQSVGKMRYCYTDPTRRPWTSVCSDRVDVNSVDLGPGFKTYVPVNWDIYET